MKLVSRLVLPGLLFLSMSVVFASEGDNTNGPSGDGDKSDLTKYLLNLGGYLGYDLKHKPGGNNAGTGTGTNTGLDDQQGSSDTGLTPLTSPISQNFLNLPALQVIGNYLFNSYLGALLVNTAAQGATQFVPTSLQAYASINAFANYTFTTPPYSSPSADKVSVSTLVDQPPYQTDPVSQGVLNILTTPDFSYCLNNDGNAVVNCTYPSGILNENQVMINTIGTIPSTQAYFTYNQIQPLLTQLNGNSLITPLLYTTTASASGSTSSGTVNSTNQGLTAQTQAQQAANFIRYATGAVIPLSFPNRNSYDALYVKAQNASGSYSQLEQQRAQATLASYLANVRVYAAQTSVGMGNLYYILSRRLPQNQSTSSAGQQTSQALSEFTMATWRLYNPDKSANTQWLAQINQASAATVQKEIAGLLAEINYQLYLSRQQEERLLLTNTMLLLQNVRASQPNSALNPAETASSTGLQ